MADETSKIASSPQGAVTVENRYLKVREKKSKTGTSKILKNISDYSQLLSKRPFAGTIQRSKKRAIDDNINRRARDAGVGSSENFSFIEYLPISGKKIEASFKQGEGLFYKISSGFMGIMASGEDSLLDSEMISEFPDLVDEIRSYSENNYCLNADQFDFLGKATILGQIFAKQIHIYASKLDKNPDISADLDFHLINFLLSLETLHPQVIAREMYNFVSIFGEKLNLICQTFEFLTDTQYTYQQKLIELKDATTQLINQLKLIVSIKITGKRSSLQMKANDERVLMPIKSLKLFISNLENYAGSTLSSMIPETPNILKKYDFEINGIKRDSNGETILENWIFTMYKDMFSTLRIESGESQRTYEINYKMFGGEYRSALLARIISDTEVISEEKYEELVSRLRHLRETAHPTHHEKILNLSNSIQDRVKELNSNNISDLLNCLKKPPSFYNSESRTLEEQFDAKSKWRNNIVEFDDYLSITKKPATKKSTKGVDSLKSFVDETEGLDYENLHLHISSAISEHRIAVAEYDAAKINLQSRLRDPLFKDKVSIQNRTLNKALESLRTKYQQAKGKLLHRDKRATEKPLHERIDQFSLDCSTIIDKFRSEVNKVDESGMPSFSGPQAAMMIGLGEGGERIVRATIAKMLNNHTDTRCSNLLSGLNIDMNKITEVVKKRSPETGTGNLEFDFVVSTNNPEDVNMTDLFEKANILAINAGPEQNDRLKEKYNYIWGTIGKNTAVGSKEGKYDSLSTNTILVDVNKNGCGGRMGKGRAFAVAAEQIIEQKLLDKRANQSIKQICIVHSFAGGSGSGMILPVLRMVKRVYPTALIWVLSAAEAMHGKAKNDEDNVIYITSDILQAHYNALHHTPKSISHSDWQKFSTSVKLKQQDLSNEWNEIWKHFPDNEPQLTQYSAEMKNRQKSLVKMINDEYSKVNFGFNTTNYTDDSEPHGFLPGFNDESTSTFQDATRDPRNRGAIKKLWFAWNETMEDPGTHIITNHPKLFTEFSKKNDTTTEEDSVEFKLNYNALMTINKGINALHTNGFNKEQAESEHKKSYGKMPELDYQLIMFGMSAQKLNENEDDELIELQKKIKSYGRKMRIYHQELVDQWELIQLNLIMKNDSLVKHIVVSNKHFDVNASGLVKRENNYEVYNSVLADTYINIIHQLVSKDSLVEDDMDLEEEIKLKEMAGSSEAMDLSDIKRRTKPTSSTISLSLNDMIQNSGCVRYNVELDREKIRSNHVYKYVFSKLFDERTSPLFNQDIEDQPPIADLDSIQGLFNNLFYSENVLVDFPPYDAIEMDEYSRKKIKDYLSLQTTRISEFYKEKVLKALDSEQRKSLDKDDFTVENFTNITYWLLMFEPKIISYIYESDHRETFTKMTTSWQETYVKTFNSESNDFVISKQVRERTVKKMVKAALSNDVDHQEPMAKLLNKFGIMNESHFAIIPSAFLYDFIPLMIDEEIYPQTVEFIGSKTGKLDINIQPDKTLFIRPKHPVVTKAMLFSTKDYDYWKRISPQLEESLGEDISLQYEENDDNIYQEFIQIRPPGDGGMWHLDISSVFIKHFAAMKCKATESYPEFASNTILNRLVNVAPNIAGGGRTRRAAEAPVYHLARNNILRNSKPKKLHRSETYSSVLLRYLFLTNKEENDASTDVLARKNIIDLDSPWVKNIVNQKNNHQYLDYDPTIFDECLQTRVNAMLEHDTISKNLETNLLLSHIKSILNEETANQQHSFSLFQSLTKKLTQNKVSILKQAIKDKLNPELVERDLIDVCSLFTRLSSMTYSAYCQFVFMKNEQADEYGVTFDYEGTLDAVRSHQEDYLAVVNASSAADKDLISLSINYFYSNYYNQRTKGKVFIQRLERGPICHITLVQQQAGVTEISDCYSRLMSKLEKKTFAAVRDPLVHPYSFLRNILWMHTFKEQWVSSPEGVFDKALDIPNSVIEKLYSEPTLVDDSARMILTDDDMYGLDFSKYDRDLRNELNLCAEPINDKNSDTHKKRIRGQIQIPDMLLICAAKERIFSGGFEGPGAFEKALKESAKNGDYPEENWNLKFIEDNINVLFKNLKPKVSDTSEIDDILGNILKPSSGSKTDKVSNWEKALKEWMKFVKQNANQ